MALKINPNNTQTLGSQPNQQTTSANQAREEKSKPETSLVTIIGQCLPFAPLVFEQFTGQKLPAMGGTIADIQTAISQINLNQQQLLTNQQEIFTRIVNLETNANTGFLSLDKRIESLQSIRLTHEKEKKSIEYNPNKPLENNHYE